MMNMMLKGVLFNGHVARKSPLPAVITWFIMNTFEHKKLEQAFGLCI